MTKDAKIDPAYIEKTILDLTADLLKYDREKLSRDTRFSDFGPDLGFDPNDAENYWTSVFELAIEYESEFDVSLPDEYIEKWQSLGDVIDYFTNLIVPVDYETEALEALKKKIAERKKVKKVDS